MTIRFGRLHGSQVDGRHMLDNREKCIERWLHRFQPTNRGVPVQAVLQHFRRGDTPVLLHDRGVQHQLGPMLARVLATYGYMGMFASTKITRQGTPLDITEHDVDVPCRK
jgi:hypothetical protein